MLKLQCDECKKEKEARVKPINFPKDWTAVLYDEREYHFCSMECAVRFLDKKVDHSEDED